MRPIDKFKKSNKPFQRSKLSELDEDILELLNDKFKPKQIHEYITFHRKISVDLSHLYKYIKKLQARDNPIAIDKSKATVVTAVPAEVTTSTIVKIDEPAQEPQKEMSFLEKTAARLKAKEEAGVKPAPVGYWKPKTFMIDIFGEQDEY